MNYQREGPATGTTQSRPQHMQTDASVPQSGYVGLDAHVAQAGNGSGLQAPQGAPGYPTPTHPAPGAPGATWGRPAGVPLPGLGLFTMDVNGQQWEPPRPLVVTSEPEPFPLDAMPPIARQAVLEVQGATQAPEAMVATCTLGAMAAAVQGMVDVARDAVLVGPCSLYVMTLASSGERKTTVDNLLTAGLRQWDAEQQQSHEAQKQTAEAALKAWTAKDNGLTDALRKAAREGHDGASDVLRHALAQHALTKPRPAHIPALLRGDDTPERLVDALVEWPVRAVVSSEAGLIFGSHGMSPEVVMRNLAQANTLWDGGRVQQGRIGRGDVSVEHARLTLSLQLQPATFEAFNGKAGDLARGIGYFARFLMCYPTSTMGTRMYAPPPEGMPALTAFNARTLELLRHAPQYVDLATGHVRPYVLRLGEYPGVKEHWTKYFDAVEVELSKGGAFCDVPDVASKIADNAARMWALFMAYDPSGSPLEHMRGACLLAQFYMSEALRFRTEVQVDAAVRRAMVLEKYLVQRVLVYGFDRVLMDDVTKRGPKATRPLAQRQDAIELLTTHARVSVQRDRLGKNAGKTYIAVNPTVLAEADRSEWEPLYVPPKPAGV